MRFYFDHNATTPVAPQVMEAHAEALREAWGNASSIHHYGQIARQRFESARAQVARLIGAAPGEIVFGSGGTEAINTVLRGARGHIVTTSIEHPAVLSTCAALDVHVTYVPVGSNGVVDPDDVRGAITPATALISVMHVNNEIGTVQPVAEIARIAREAGVLFHSDGVQAAGRIPVDVRALGVDFYSASGHKMYAPKGTGVLYLRSGLDWPPLICGGRHERGRRAGTENVAGAIAMGVAAEIAPAHFMDSTLRDRLETSIVDRIPHVIVNGAAGPRVPSTTNICFDGIEGEAIVIALDLKGFCVSSGSACSSGAVEPSHVLTAIGLSRRQAKSSIRFSLGRGNTADQVDALVDALVDVVDRLRKLSTDFAYA